MRKIGVLAAGEPLPANEGDDALKVFAQMVDAWTNETLLIPVVSVVTHQLTINQSSYTIGVYPEPKPDPLPDNHIETARPVKILSSFIRDQYDTDYLVTPMAVTTFSGISRKTNESRPSYIYMREGWPLNELIFDSLPYDSETLHLEVIQPLSGILPIACLTEVISLPPGYERALIYNLCLDLADEWGKQVSNTIAIHATEGKKWLKRNNYRDIALRVDPAIASRQSGYGTYDITGGP